MLADGVMLGSGWRERTDKLPQFVSVGEPQLVKWRQIAQANKRPFPEPSLQMSHIVPRASSVWKRSHHGAGVRTTATGRRGMEPCPPRPLAMLCPSRAARLSA